MGRYWNLTKRAYRRNDPFGLYAIERAMKNGFSDSYHRESAVKGLTKGLVTIPIATLVLATPTWAPYALNKWNDHRVSSYATKQESILNTVQRTPESVNRDELVDVIIGFESLPQKREDVKLLYENNLELKAAILSNSKK